MSDKAMYGVYIYICMRIYVRVAVLTVRAEVHEFKTDRVSNVLVTCSSGTYTDNIHMRHTYINSHELDCSTSD